MRMELEPNAILGLFLLGSVTLATLITLRKIRISARHTKRNEHYQRVISDLDHLIRIDPTNALAIWRKGEIYEAMGNAEQAIRFYRVAHMMCPKAYSTGDYSDAFVRISKSRPDLGLRLQTQQSGSH